MATANDAEGTRGRLGQGLYSLSELGRFVAYEGGPEDIDRVDYWLTSVLNPVEHEPYQADHSFGDLISLFVVRELLRAGVRPVRIRDAERHLRQLWGRDRPFVSERIATDGTEVFPEDRERQPWLPEQIETASRHGQYAMVEPIRDRLRTVRYHEGEADRWEPAKHIVLDPDVQFGEPVVEGTRVLVADVYEAAAEHGIEWAATMYAVPPRAVVSAMNFQRRLALLAD